MKKIALTGSLFDWLHAGHVYMLRPSPLPSYYLLCGLTVDPSLDRPEKNKPIQTIVERYSQLNAVEYVDEIIPYITEQDLEDILSMLHIDVRIIGSEYKSGTFTGRAICSSRGIEIYYNQRDHRFSTSDLRNRVCIKELDSDSKL